MSIVIGQYYHSIKENYVSLCSNIFIFELHCAGKMLWIFRSFILFASFTILITAEDQCRTEINIRGMALKGFVFKRKSVEAPHLCDILCEREITCQSYNFNRKEKICELNYRTKEARPENFRSDPPWFYIRRLNGRGKYSAEYNEKLLFGHTRIISQSVC